MISRTAISLSEALVLALNEDRGGLIVFLSHLCATDLVRVIDAAQVLDSEAQDALDSALLNAQAEGESE